MKKVTGKDIKNYVSGNVNLIKERLNALPEHIKEQVGYRHLKCINDCVKVGKCKHCGCPLPGRHFATSSCNISRFPDLMEEKEWEEFKKKYIDEKEV